jgi:hypothetical protein
MHLIAAMSADGTSITFVPLGPLPRIAYASVQSVGRGFGNEATRIHWAGGDGPSQHKALAGGFAHLPEARQRDGARLVRSVALPVAGEVEPDLHPVDRRLRRG